MTKMNTNDQEPSQPPLEPTLRSHTTLRTLFLVTVVAALVVAIWVSSPYRPVCWVVASCAASFLSGLFGMSLWAGFIIGLVIAVVGDVYLIATFPLRNMPLGTAFRFAVQDASKAVFGISWLTASWWDLYLRYAWSNSKWPPTVEENCGISGRWPLRIRERLIVRCAYEPEGFMIVSLFANMFAFAVACMVLI